jgi:hypothetical protein
MTADHASDNIPKFYTTAKSAEQSAKAVTAETQSTKRAAVTAPVPFSSEDNIPQEYSAPAPAQASAPVAAAAAPAAKEFSNSGKDFNRYK